VTLNDKQIHAFQEAGYLVVNNVFFESEIRELRAEANRLLEFLVNSSLANHRRSARLDLRETPSGVHIVRRIRPFTDISPKFAALAKYSRLLRPISQLQGDEPKLMEESISYKQQLPEPVRGVELLKEADDQFHPHQEYVDDVTYGCAPTAVIAAVVMDDCPVETGPLRVWPGTHAEPIAHETVMTGTYQSLRVPAARINSLDAVDLTVSAGSLILFHALLVHSSGPNRTQWPRRLPLFIYCPSSTTLPHDIRNGPTRAAEALYERKYQALLEQERFTDRFRLPVEE
jgi:ectoine hydroxylase-related dioxygenase (phytanoyl-CoA dioxygenase family)